MKEEARRAIAFSAAAQSNRRASSSVYSDEAGKHGTMSGNSVQIYDYGEGRYFNYTV